MPRQNDPAFHFALTRLEAIKYLRRLRAVLVAHGQREMEKRVKPGRNSTVHKILHGVFDVRSRRLFCGCANGLAACGSNRARSQVLFYVANFSDFASQKRASAF